MKWVDLPIWVLQLPVTIVEFPEFFGHLSSMRVWLFVDFAGNYCVKTDLIDICQRLKW
jgi:hypothetical protein